MDDSIYSSTDSLPPVPPAAASVASADEDTRPLPRDMSHHFSYLTKARTPSKMKEYYKYFLIPGIGQLAGGLPNSQYFPFDTLEAQTAKPNRWTPTANRPGGDGDSDDDAAYLSSQVASTSLSSSSAKTASHVVVPHDAATSDPVKRIDLASALQYGQALGYPPLYSFVRQFARECLHPNVPYRGGPEVIFTNGSTDGMAKSLELFTNVWVEGKDDIRERPGLLSEVFMYSNVMSQSLPRGVQLVPVEVDDEGMAPYGPGGLEDVLANWDETKGKRPHLMYTVTMGHNPIGGVLSVQRRKELYALCSKYDVIIVEDEPYWYLQYPSAELEEAKARNRPVPTQPKLVNTLEKKSGYTYLDSLVPSYLSIDTDGRVVRLDTFSKTIAPGCRMGFITAAPEICERVMRISESSTQQPSGFAQAVIAEAIMGPQPDGTTAAFHKSRSSGGNAADFSGWKMDGWVRWLAGLRGEYERRMNRMCTVLEENAYQLKQSTPVRDTESDWGVITKTRLYDFDWPRAGMFLWLRMRFETHPLWKAVGSTGNVINGVALSTALMLFLTHKPHLVLVSPGLMFSTTDKIREERGWAYYRMTFAAETDDNVDACSLRFALGVQKFWRIKKVKELEALLDEMNSAGLRETVGTGGVANLGSYLGC